MPDQRDEIFEQLRDAVQDRYTVQRELGRGGMARVYLAEEHNPRRQVAIKVMNPEIASARMRARFLREIDLASKLTHPHIVPVFAAGEEDDLLYYMMPYITGESLRVILDRQGQLSNDEALRIAFAIAEALSYAHTRGVVHRDIKPENVLLSDGHAVVLDFGVARAFADSDAPALTQAGTPVGTPAYMSPEQWAGETVDGRTDIFSLGCVLYEMAFGRVAEGAPADRAAVVARTMRRSGSDAAALTIAMVVARCLEPNRDDRFASAEALVESLLAGVHPSGPVSQPSVVKGLAVLAIIVLVAIGVRVASTRVAGRGDEGVRVAVAVLENQTGDSDLDPLGVMASDWITQGLMRTGLVEVVGTRTSLALSGAAIAEEANPITGLAVATDADIVISGRYYRQGSESQFAVQLTDLRNESQLIILDPVTAAIDSPLIAIEELRQRVMGALASQLDQRFGVWTTTGLSPPSYEAYREFVAGQVAFQRLDIAAALPHYYRAAELDPSFPGPMLMAAFAAAAADMWPLADSLALIVETQRASLDPAHSYVLDWILNLASGRPAQAYTAIQRAANIVSGPEMTAFVAVTELWLNRPADAFRRLQDLDPTSDLVAEMFYYWDLDTDVLHLLGRHRQELADALRAYELHGDIDLSAIGLVRAWAAVGRADDIDRFIAGAARTGYGRLGMVDEGDVLRTAALELRAHGFAETAEEFSDREIAWYTRRVAGGESDENDLYGFARALYMGGEYADAAPLFARLYESNRDSIAYLGYSASTAARLGDRARALELSDSLTTMERRFLFGHRQYWQARIAAVLGDREDAIRYLNDAYRAGRLFRINAHTDIDLRELRGYLAYEELMRPRG